MSCTVIGKINDSSICIQVAQIIVFSITEIHPCTSRINQVCQIVACCGRTILRFLQISIGILDTPHVFVLTKRIFPAVFVLHDVIGISVGGACLRQLISKAIFIL